MRWPFGAAATILLIVLAALIYLSFEPLTVFDYGGGSLAESLEGEAPEEWGDAECTRAARPGAWRCLVETTSGGSFGAAYDLTVGEDGCWTARSIPYNNTPPQDETRSACVDLLDVTGISSLLDL